MIERDELAAWLNLLETPGLGTVSVLALLARWGSPQAALAQAAGPPPAYLPELLERTWAWLQADASHQILVLGDADYPELLLQTADPPPLLYLWGRRELLAAPSLAIVGSRSPTAQGRDNAEHFARELSTAGLSIVSGLALGVDGAAHQGALASEAGTIAVVGTGLDQIYPRRHQKLGQEIAARGLMLSEYPLGMPPLPPNFPRRNRIIAGLSLGCLVVEAALKSGPLITARLASEAGREVFAIPGSIHSALSQGCHALIRQGAKLVETAADVLEELPLERRRPAPTAPATPESGLSREQLQLLAQMGFDPVSLDSLQQRGGWPTAELSAHLLELEMAGVVARLPGQRFQRRVGT